MDERIKVQMVTAVWGEWHVDALLEVNLRTLLAPGNLPHFARHHDLQYRIHTRPSDRSRIENAQAIREIAGFMDVAVEGSLPEKDAGDIFSVHHAAWAAASDEAKRLGAFIMNMPPDVAFADGSLANLLGPLAAGKKSINWAYSRAVAETFVPALNDRFGDNESALIVSPRDMVALNLRNLHPLSVACFADSPFFVKHPELILWPVRGEGLLLRVLATVNHLYDPGYFELTENHLIRSCHDGTSIDMNDVHHFDDSDDFFVVSLAPLGKDFEWHEVGQGAEASVIGRWWLHYDSPANDFFAGHRIRWHETEATDSAWRATERGSDQFLNRATAAREGLRIWRAAIDMEHNIAGSVVALALETGALLRGFPRNRPAIVFLPNDAILRRLPADDLNRLLTGDGGRRLICFLRRHVVFDDDPSTPLHARIAEGSTIQLTSAAGEPIEVEALADGVSVDGVLDLSDEMRQVVRFLGRHDLFEEKESGEDDGGTAGEKVIRLTGPGGRPVEIGRVSGAALVNGMLVSQTPLRVGRHQVYGLGGVLDEDVAGAIGNAEEDDEGAIGDVA